VRVALRVRCPLRIHCNESALSSTAAARIVQ
jgi:hypothetical protein